jgi:hypothetical protein
MYRMLPSFAAAMYQHSSNGVSAFVHERENATAGAGLRPPNRTGKGERAMIAVCHDPNANE